MHSCHETVGIGEGRQHSGGWHLRHHLYALFRGLCISRLRDVVSSLQIERLRAETSACLPNPWSFGP